MLTAVALLIVANAKGDALVRKIDAVKIPVPDIEEMRTPKLAADFHRRRLAATAQRNALILRLYQTDPAHPRTVPLMRERWERLEAGPVTDGPAYLRRVLADIDRVLARRPTRKIREVGEAARIMARLNYDQPRWNGVSTAVRGFFARYPSSPEGVNMLLTWIYASSDAEQRAACDTFATQYPHHAFTPRVRGMARQSRDLGKRFDLRFTDAITGRPFDIRDYRGKVVAVDFWATWCGPCVTKLPEVKRIRDQYRDQGFEVVGVSLDVPEKQGGLKDLRAFLAKNPYDWPQYYQGNGWDGAFSASWGIMAIPNVFLIDRKGNLREIDAPDLEASVKRLLAEGP
jgi:thiol-disulfide isomerase/thioredoxin